MGISAAAISDFELGKSWPRLETLYVLATELELSLDALFSGVPASRESPVS